MSKEIVKASQQAVEQFNWFNPEHFATMQRVAGAFVTADLIPETYRVIVNEKDPKKSRTREQAVANAMIAIETANRIGASPLLVMQNLNIIQGRPAWSAKFLIATVNSCGKYESLKYKFRDGGNLKGLETTVEEWDQQTRSKVSRKIIFKEDLMDMECIAYTKEKGSDEILESPPISLKMAIQEGWYTKKGSKWVTMPKVMLQYRAASFWTNAYAPELSMGIRTVEEQVDIEDIDHEVMESKLTADLKPVVTMEPEVKPEEAKPEDKKEENPI